MSEEIKSEEIKSEEVSEEINPIDEYLNRYKEQRLAEFCVKKDKEIGCLENERLELIEQLAEMRHKVEKYDKYFSNTHELYKRIKEIPVDSYLDLYNRFVDDISRRNVSTCTITPEFHLYSN